MKAKDKINRARNFCQHNGLPTDNPDLFYLLLDEMRTANFRLAVLIGSNVVLVALLLALMLS